MLQCLLLLRRICHVSAFGCLALGYVLFVLFGALAFMAIEMPVERTLRAEVAALRRAFLRENACIRESRLDELLEVALATDQKDVSVLKADGEEHNYDLTSSFYFVIVTLTTTGYDFFTPISQEAKLFCIFYCSLGIPLTLFLLTLLSDLLLPVVTHGPVCRLHTHWGVAYARAPLLHAGVLCALIVVALFLVPALLIYGLEPGWSYLDALFFCFLTLTTIGQGGYSLGRTWGQAAKDTLKLLTTCYLLVGLVVLMLFRETALEVPQVQAVMRLFAGRRELELKGERLDELELAGSEDTPRYTLPISTISSGPWEPSLPSPDQPSFPVLQRGLAFRPARATDPGPDSKESPDANSEMLQNIS